MPDRVDTPPDEGKDGDVAAHLPGVIAATRGNHGQSVAFAATRHGLAATVVVPEGNSHEKNNAMRAFGAELIVHGGDFQEALEYARNLAQEKGLHLVPPFDFALVRGVVTYALEFFKAVPNVDAFFVPVGQGSGICSAIAARDALGLRTQVIGVVAAAFPSYKVSFEAGTAISTPPAHTIADGVACRVPTEEALDEILRGAERFVSVTDEEIRSAMSAYYSDTHNVVEGAGAAPLAALLKEKERWKGRRVGLVASGGNVDRDVFREVLRVLPNWIWPERRTFRQRTGGLRRRGRAMEPRIRVGDHNAVRCQMNRREERVAPI